MLHSEPLLAKQPPREIHHEHALPGIGLMPCADDENLRKRIPDGQKRCDLPPGFETHNVFKFRNREAMRVDIYREFEIPKFRPRSQHAGSEVNAHPRMLQCWHQR